MDVLETVLVRQFRYSRSPPAVKTVYYFVPVPKYYEYTKDTYIELFVSLTFCSNHYMKVLERPTMTILKHTYPLL